MTIEAADLDVPFAPCASTNAWGAIGRAASRSLAVECAFQAERRAVEAREPSLVAAQKMRPRGRATWPIVVFDRRRANSERACSLGIDDDALLTSARAIANGEDLFVPTGQRSSLEVAEADRTLGTTPAAGIGTRPVQCARAEARTGVGLEPAFAHGQREIDCRRR